MKKLNGDTMENKPVYKDENGKVLYGYSQLDQAKLVHWFKIFAISFLILVIFIIVFFLWLKFSGVGHNIIYELSGK